MSRTQLFGYSLAPLVSALLMEIAIAAGADEEDQLRTGFFTVMYWSVFAMAGAQHEWREPSRARGLSPRVRFDHVICYCEK